MRQYLGLALLLAVVGVSCATLEPIVTPAPALKPQAIPTLAPTPVSKSTSTPTPTNTPTPAPSPTQTPLTPTPTLGATSTPTLTPTATPTPAPIPTASPTQAPTPTPEPTPVPNCDPPDNLNWVAGEGECLKIKTLNKELSGKNPTLVVFLHGDVSGGGPASYYYSRAERFEGSSAVPVVLIRPGYYDSQGNYSTGSDCGRGDCYTPHNVDAIAEAIKSIKEFHKARNVILVGHSGGAAIAGVIIGRHPGLVDGAVLAACPCNMDEFNELRLSRGRRAWSSLSPHSFVDGIPPTTQVIAITGDEDEKTPPFLAERYIKELQAMSIEASFVSIEGGTHNGSAGSSEFYDAIWGLIGDKK